MIATSRHVRRIVRAAISHDLTIESRRERTKKKNRMCASRSCERLSSARTLTNRTTFALRIRRPTRSARAAPRCVADFVMSSMGSCALRSALELFAEQQLLFSFLLVLSEFMVGETADCLVCTCFQYAAVESYVLAACPEYTCFSMLLVQVYRRPVVWSHRHTRSFREKRPRLRATASDCERPAAAMTLSVFVTGYGLLRDDVVRVILDSATGECMQRV